MSGLPGGLSFLCRQEEQRGTRWTPLTFAPDPQAAQAGRAERAGRLRGNCRWIAVGIEAHTKTAAEQILYNGKLLCEARELLKADQEFGEWRKERLPWLDKRMAEHWMNAYRNGGEALVRNNFAPTSVYLLTAPSVPEPAPASVNTGANLAGENQTFAFRGQNVRTVIRDGEPWFVAKDVCDVLGIANSRDAVAELDEDEKITVGNPDGNPRAGNPLTFNVVNESGLHALIFKSRKPEAKVFRKWVTSEVLPALRKTGHYAMPKAPEPAPCKTWGKDNLPTAANDGRRESILPDSKNRPIPCVHQTAQIMPAFLNDFPAQIDGVIFGVIHFFGILAKPSIHVHSCVHL